MKKHVKLLKNYKNKNLIDFEIKFGTLICYTLILALKNPFFFMSSKTDLCCPFLP